MKTIKLDKNAPSLNKLLAMAANEAVLLLSEDGKAFLLEEADQFEQEVASFGASDRFMTFLENRAREQKTTSLQEIARHLDSKKQ